MSDQEDTPKRAPSAIGRAFRKFCFLLALLVIAWVIFAQALPRLLPHPNESDIGARRQGLQDAVRQRDEKLEALSGRVDQMEARLKAMEDAFATPGKEAAAPDPRVDALQAKLDALQQQGLVHTAGPVSDEARLARLEDALDKQEEKLSAVSRQLGDVANKDDSRLAALTVFGQIKEEAQRGSAFAPELTQLAQLTAGDTQAQAAIAQLLPHANENNVTLASLQERFSPLVAKALQPPGDGVTSKLQSLIRIRKVGEQTGDDDESILARAEAKLGKGDVAAAMQEMTPLAPSAANAMAPWKEKAQRYLDLHAGLDALQLALAHAPAPAPAAPPAAPEPASEPAPPAAAPAPPASPASGE